MSHNPAIRKLEQESHEHHDAITAILSEHLPAEVMRSVLVHIDGLVSGAYETANEMERYAYGLLYVMLSDHVAEIRSAWTVALWPGCEPDWRQYEAGLPVEFMTETKLLDKWKETGEL